MELELKFSLRFSDLGSISKLLSSLLSVISFVDFHVDDPKLGHFMSKFYDSKDQKFDKFWKKLRSKINNHKRKLRIQIERLEIIQNQLWIRLSGLQEKTREIVGQLIDKICLFLNHMGPFELLEKLAIDSLMEILKLYFFDQPAVEIIRYLYDHGRLIAEIICMAYDLNAFAK